MCQKAKFAFGSGACHPSMPAAIAERFRGQVRTMLPAVFLREIMGWTSAELEAIRTRDWDATAPSW